MRDASPADRRRNRAVDRVVARRQARWLTCALAALAAAPTQAQGVSAGARDLSIQPWASITETLTNNAEVSSTQSRSDAITRVSAGVSFQSRSGRLRGYLDYGLSGFLYARNSELNTYQNSLNASLGAELIENRARVDVRAGISQSAISAFGAQPGASGLPSSNVSEFRTFSITPSFNGPLGPAAKYDAGLTYATSNASSSSAGDSTTASVFIRLGPSARGVVGWSVDMTSVQSDYAAGRTTVDNRLNGTLSRKIEALDLLVNATAGVELTDLSALERARYQNWGIGATWIPSPRTKLVAQWDERFFGNGHVLSFEHRTALTTWTISDTRSLNSSGNGATAGGRGTNFDLYFAQFATIEPDPVKRTDLVNSYLKSNGLSPTTVADAGYLRSGETVVRAQNVSVAYRGQRGAAVLVINRSVTAPIEGAPLPSGDFVNTSRIVTDRASVTLSHRLTPLSSANLIVSYQQSHGDRPEQTSHQRELNLQYRVQVNPQSDLTAGARRALYKDFETPYNETAVFATYGIRF